MSLAVFIAFVGALVAVVGTGMLFGRFIRSPRSDFAAWSSVMLALAVALGAQAMGFALGFSGATFRAAEIAGLLLAPLWTAWGLIELAGQSVPARFAARLVTAALTVMAGVILILDPLSAAGSFRKAWPGGSHYMMLPRTALTLVHVIAVAAALVVMITTAVRTRRDPAWWDVFLPAAVAGGAVLLMVSMGLTLPATAYPLLASASAGLVWFAANRAEQLDLVALRAAEMPSAAEMSRGRRRRGRAALEADDPGGFDGDDMLGGSLRARGPEPSANGLTGELADGLTGVPGPAHGTVSVPVPGSAPQPEPPTVPVPAAGGAGAGMQADAAAKSLFGLIAIYTLVEGGGDDFDRLAEQTVEAVKRHEPDTLLFVVHTVPNAPLQRIFYEVYRDRMAYNDHRLQPEVEDFFAKHRPYVLATNVIELDLTYAKVTALPSPSSVLEGAAGLPPPSGLSGGSALPPASGLPGSSALPGPTRSSAGSGRSPGTVGPHSRSGVTPRDEWAMTRNERRP
jgi:quinol monooxygenase YgiN